MPGLGWDTPHQTIFLEGSGLWELLFGDLIRQILEVNLVKRNMLTPGLG